MKFKLALPLILLLLYLICIGLVVNASQILNKAAYQGEANFVFLLIAMLLQPIPTSVMFIFAKIPYLGNFLENPYTQIAWVTILGCIQWWLIGVGILRLLEYKRRGLLQQAALLELIALALAFSLYTTSLLFQLDELRPRTEIAFVYLWSLAALLLVFFCLKKLIFIIRVKPT